MSPQSDSQRIERLVGLCKLWGAVKYFHPYLPYRTDIDWDAALVSVLPEIRAAKDAGEFAAAVQDMLAALADPATKVISQESAVEDDSSSRERQPSYRFTEDDILVVSITHYQDLTDYVGVDRKLEAIKKEIPQAKGVIFDFRSNRDTSPERGYLTFSFQWNEIANLLTSTEVVTAGERSRLHTGFVPHKGKTTGNYSSAFQVLDGYRISPSPQAKDLPVVFLINEWSELPPEAFALQIAGKAAILAEGGASDASLVKTHQISLADGVVAKIRLSEMILADGSGGVVPDLIIPAHRDEEGQDQGLSTAFEFLKDFKPGMVARRPLPACAVLLPENAYPEMKLPSLEYRLLSAFRIWNVINYFFPYKHLMDGDWEAVLREFIPKMEQAESALEYHLAVAEMVSRIHDSHGNVDSPVLNDHFGSALPPISVQMIEGAPLITAILDQEIAQSAGVKVGDVILMIDGEDVRERMAHRAKYLAASTPQRLMFRAANASLSGPEGSVVTLTIRQPGDRVREVSLPRKPEYSSGYGKWRSGEVVKLLSEEIGYTDLDRLEVPDIDEMFEEFKNTRAIIFDMRGYPNGTAWEIAPRLADKSNLGAALFHCPVVRTPEGATGEIESQSMSHSFVQTIPGTQKWHYSGKTVMLVDERTQSQAEHAGLFFEAANRTKFIGSHSSGANGDVTNFYVPGGINVRFTGQSVSHVDGRQLQRIGLVPDLEIKPTIVGVQSGKDEVLEAAIQYLQREIDHG